MSSLTTPCYQTFLYCWITGRYWPNPYFTSVDWSHHCHTSTIGPLSLGQKLLLSDWGCIQPDVRSRKGGRPVLPASCLLLPASCFLGYFVRACTEDLACWYFFSWFIIWLSGNYKVLSIGQTNSRYLSVSFCLVQHRISTGICTVRVSWTCSARSSMSISIPSQITVDGKSVHLQ